MNIEVQKPNSVKTVGLLIVIFSVFIVFSNGIGALMFSLIGMGDQKNEPAGTSGSSFLEFLFMNYIIMCLVMVAIGILYFIGGLNIRKYKLWANKLVTYISILLVVLVWIVLISMSVITSGQKDFEIFSIATIIIALLWSVPFGLLIWFLNKGNIKKHFV